MDDRATTPTTLEGKTALVAGAAGFIPSHLCETLLRAGAKVVGIDNFLTGQEANIEFLGRFEKFSFERGNIHSPLPSFKGIPIDYVFSFASPASPRDFGRQPVEIMRANSPEGDTTIQRPSLDRLRSIRGYEPLVTLKEGIKTTAEYFKTAPHGKAYWAGGRAKKGGFIPSLWL